MVDACNKILCLWPWERFITVIDRTNSIPFKNVNGIPSFTNYLLLIFFCILCYLWIHWGFQCRKCKANKEKVRSIKIQFLKSRKLRDANISDRQWEWDLGNYPILLSVRSFGVVAIYRFKKFHYNIFILIHSHTLPNETKSK